METIVPDSCVSRPLNLHASLIICPIEHISPPTQNALKQFLRIGELGDLEFT